MRPRSCDPRRRQHSCVYRKVGARADPDLTELALPDTMQTQFPNPADMMHFTLSIAPDEGRSAR